MTVNCDICRKPVKLKATTNGETFREWEGQCSCGAVIEVRRYVD